MSSNHVDLCFERKNVIHLCHGKFMIYTFTFYPCTAKNVVAINAQEKILLNAPITVIADTIYATCTVAQVKA